jgi:hypothetical protein
MFRAHNSQLTTHNSQLTTHNSVLLARCLLAIVIVIGTH